MLIRELVNESPDRIRALQRALIAQGADLCNFGPKKDGVDGVIGAYTQRAIDNVKYKDTVNQFSDVTAKKFGSRSLQPKTATVVDPTLLAAVKAAESGGDHSAVSARGAVGSMQVMPKTLKNPGYGVRPARDMSSAELERVGKDYFTALYRKYNDPVAALVAYNWGPGKANRWLADGSDIQALPRETRAYVPRVLELWSSMSGTKVAALDQFKTA